MDKMESYDRIYYAFGPNDPIVERPKMVNDKEVGKVTVPQEARSGKTVHPSRDLLKDALADLQAKNPKSDPVLILLSGFDYGNDLQDQAPIRARLSGKPIDEDKATEKMAKALVAMGNFATVDEATAFVRSLPKLAAATA
jgi:hypothetical protein